MMGRHTTHRHLGNYHADRRSNQARVQTSWEDAESIVTEGRQRHDENDNAMSVRKRRGSDQSPAVRR